MRSCAISGNTLAIYVHNLIRSHSAPGSLLYKAPNAPSAASKRSKTTFSIVPVTQQAVTEWAQSNNNNKRKVLRNVHVWEITLKWILGHRDVFVVMNMEEKLFTRHGDNHDEIERCGWCYLPLRFFFLFERTNNPNDDIKNILSYIRHKVDPLTLLNKASLKRFDTHLSAHIWIKTWMLFALWYIFNIQIISNVSSFNYWSIYPLAT